MKHTHYRLWLYFLLFFIAILSLLWEGSSQAAPHRTVPKFTPQPTHTPTPVPRATVDPSNRARNMAEWASEMTTLDDKFRESAGLTLQINPNPLLVQQGEFVTVQFDIINQSDQVATNVLLSDAFPIGLSIVNLESDGKNSYEQDEDGRTSLKVLWSQVLPRQSVSANAHLLVATDLPDGAVLENLAAVYSVEVPGQTVGLRIGLPPSRVPYFDTEKK